MASTPFSRDNPMEFPSVQDEKRHLQSQDTELPHPVNTPKPKKKMATSTRIVIAVLFGMLVSVTLALGPRMAGCLQHREANAEASRDGLHRLLHDHLPEKFQDGVYPTDEEAVRALHEEHAELASSLVQLAKRQNNSTDEPEPEPTTTPDDPQPTEEPTTTPDDPPTTKETTTTTTSSSSTPPGPTPTPSDDDEPGTSSPPRETLPESPGSSIPSPTPSTPSTTPPSSSTPPSSEDTSPISSSTKSAPTTKKTTSKSSTVHTRTSTLPGGDVTIVTSTSYYDVLPEETGTNKEDPSLQNAAPGQTGFAMPALFVAVAGGLLIM